MEEEFEIDINEAEPAFLKGQSSRSGVEVSPIKIVKNPDGSMQVRGHPLTATNEMSIHLMPGHL